MIEKANLWYSFAGYESTDPIRGYPPPPLALDAFEMDT